MEKEKNNNGLIIGIVIFLILSLLLVFYFIFQIISVDNKNQNESKEEEIQQTEEIGFTELTQYTLEDGEEKEIVVDGQKIVIKKDNNKYYINEKEIENEETQYENNVYVTSNLIFFTYSAGKFGNKYNVYTMDGNKINIIDNGGLDTQYNNIRLKNNKIYVDNQVRGDCLDKNANCYFYERLDTLCENENNKNINEYSDELEKHKDDELSKTYEIKYNGKEVIIEKAEDINTIGKWIETFEKICLVKE